MIRSSHSFVRWIPVGLCLSGLVAVVSLAARANNAGKRPPVFKPQASLEDWMHLNKDLNKKLRKNLGKEPDFKKVQKYAMLVAEIANVVQYHRSPDVEDWWTWAGQFRNGAKKVAAAAKREDLAATRAAVKAMSRSCKQCHDKYQE